MQLGETEFPRLMVAALRGGSGKTILSVGVIAALIKRGKSVAPFKKGPDYIDAGWLALAAGRPCYNLDSFLLSPPDNLQSFRSHSSDCDIAVIEGNRGLYDGIDLEGSTSTAELAKLLDCPVVLGVDCTKITRTMAAIVAGCARFDPAVMLNGVILNRVAGARHEKKLRDSIEHYCGIPVIGAIPKIGAQHFPERHLGLVPTPEHDWAQNSIAAITHIVEQHIDLDALISIAQKAPALAGEGRGPRAEGQEQKSEGGRRKAETRWLTTAVGSQKTADKGRKAKIEVRPPAVRIGVIKDSAFQFYYPENIDALIAQGTEIVYVSPLRDREMPELDALYIGGGFPETHAKALADNIPFKSQLKSLADDGFPIYAECGGLMYLGEKLVFAGQSYSMVGIFPVTFDFYKKPQGHGYTIVKVIRENPYYDVGSEIRGHEFHYSRVSNWDGDRGDLVFRMQRGVGIQKDRDGLLFKNVLATYTHIHAVGTPQWIGALVRNAIQFKSR